MTQHGPEPHEVPRDPALQEAFAAFLHQTHVPVDFHARVMGRVQQQRARRGRVGWWHRGAWRRAVVLWGRRVGVPQGDCGADVQEASRQGRRSWWAWLAPVAHRPWVTALATGLLMSVGLNTWLGCQVLQRRTQGTRQASGDTTVPFRVRGGPPGGPPPHPAETGLAAEAELVRTLTALADNSYHLGQYTRSIQVASAALILDPQAALAYFYRGLAYDGLGKRLQAIEDMRRAARLGLVQAPEVLRTWGVD